MQHNYTYNLPRETFNLLEETFGSKEKAEIFAGTMEKFLSQIDDKAVFMITDKLENIRFQIKEDLASTLVTREMFEERFKSIDGRFKSIDEHFNLMDERFKSIDERFNLMDERFKSIDERFSEMNNKFDERFQMINDKFDEKFKNLNFRFSILIALVIMALTFANPAFIKLLEKLLF